MSILKKNRNAFRPTLDGALEDRVVMSASPASVMRAQAAGMVTPSQVSQVRSLFTQQFNASNQQLRTYAQNLITAAYRNGRPTAAQLSDLNANLSGAINAAALRLSAQSSLLPGSSRFVTGLQNSLLGSARNNLSSRLSTLTNNARLANNPNALSGAITGLLNSTAQANNSQLSRFFQTNNFNQTSVNPTTGQPVSLTQYMGQQAMNQFSNTYGAIANTFTTAARNSLFANGGVPTSQQFNAFTPQLRSALNTANYQLGGLFNVIPGASNSQLGQQLQTGFFGNNLTGSQANPGLLGSLNNLGGTSGFTNFQDFQTRANTAFNSAFTNLATPLGTAFGQTGQMTFPTSNFQSVLGSNFTGNNFASGFNTGFGSGFTGFGTTPTTGFNQNFGTGYNSLITGVSNPLTGTGFNGTTPNAGGSNNGGVTGGIGLGSGGTTTNAGGFTTTTGGFQSGMGSFFA